MNLAQILQLIASLEPEVLALIKSVVDATHAVHQLGTKVVNSVK